MVKVSKGYFADFYNCPSSRLNLKLTMEFSNSLLFIFMHYIGQFNFTIKVAPGRQWVNNTTKTHSEPAGESSDPQECYGLANGGFPT